MRGKKSVVLIMVSLLFIGTVTSAILFQTEAISNDKENVEGNTILKRCSDVKTLQEESVVPSFDKDLNDIAESPWPKFRGDRRNTGLSPYDTSHLTGTERWSFEAEDKIQSSPAIDEEGTIYFGSRDGNLYAVDRDGEEIWRFEAGDMITSSPAIGEEGTIYFGSRDGNLYAVNPDGRERWSFETGSWVESSPTIDEQGNIYFGSYDGSLYALDPDGRIRWDFESGGDIFSSPAIGEEGTIYFGSDDQNLYAISQEGEEKWSLEMDGYIRSSPTIGSEGTIFVGTGTGIIHAVDQSGEEIWNFETGDEIWSSPAIGEDGTIYIGSDDHHLYAVDSHGTERWSFDSGGFVRSSPAVSGDGTVFMGSESGIIHAVDQDGEEIWNFETGDEIWSSPAIGEDGTVYIGSDDENLYALGTDEKVQLTIDSTDGGDVIQPGEDVYDYYLETTVELEAKSYKNYHFVGWRGDNETIEDPESRLTAIKMEDHHAVTAVFALETRELNITIEGMGSTEPEEGLHEYEHGEEVSVEAIPESGWRFVRWQGDHPEREERERTIDIIMDDDKNLVALFEETEEGMFTLTVSIEGNGDVDIDPEREVYEEGSKVTLTAVPDEGWKFNRWLGDIEGDEDFINATVDTDMEITAQFVELSEAYFEVRITSPREGEKFNEGEEIILEYEVKNIGNTTGVKTIELRVDGELVDAKENVILEAGEMDERFFRWEARGDGDVELTIRSLSDDSQEGDSSSIMINIQEDETWPYHWFVLIGLVIVVVIIVGLYMNKKKGDKETKGEQNRDEKTESFPKR